MGAIAVVYHRTGSPPDPSTVRRMLRAAPHRGTETSWVTSGRAVLAAVNDPEWVTATVAQRNGTAAALCGTIDNTDEVVRILTRDGWDIVDRAPAALVLALFRGRGPGVFAGLRGSFAGVVVDGPDLWCFRDHFGCRPLFYRDETERFMAATEVKQVLEGAGVRREPDLDHLYRTVFGGVATSTAFVGVNRVPRGHYGSVAPDRPAEFTRYWDPEALVETGTEDEGEALEGVRFLLGQATRRCLVGRDALLLSGGLDSPSLAAMAVGTSPGRPVIALTAGYERYPSVDETSWTRLAAAHVGMPLETFQASAASLDDLEQWTELLDGPVDRLSIPENAEAYRIARRRLGARCVINGEIAESLFQCDGYLLDHLVSHRRWSPLRRQIAARRARGRSWRWILREMARLAAPPAVVHGIKSRRLRRRGIPGLAPWLDAGRMLDAPRLPSLLAMSPRDRWRLLQVRAFEGAGEALEADEICAAVNGVDSRRPFCDVDLWAHVLSLPAEIKYPDLRVKHLLREAMRGELPDELLDRPDKTYFDEFHLAHAEYDTLKRYLIHPEHRLPGVDYELLAQRLEDSRMGIGELQRARDLVRVHAFLDLWS